MTPEIIASSRQMDALLEQLNDTTLIAVDTEFFRETSYYPQLALVQIASDSLVACIDPLAFDAKPALKKLLLNKKITKIFHACSQDLEVLFYYLGEAPDTIYDTQIANALLTEHHQIGYAALVENELGILLDKSQTRTNWLHRPLTQKQIQYAGDDVYYLYQLQHILDEKLRLLDRKTWFDEDALKLTTNQNSFLPVIKNLWKRVKGANRLNRQKLAVAQAIAEWRENIAQQTDKTRRKILADDIVIKLAFDATDTVQDIETIIGSKYHFKQQEKQRLLQTIKQARLLPLHQCPDNRFDTLDNEQKNILKKMQQAASYTAEKLGISTAVLCSKKELEQLVLLRQKGDKSGIQDLNIMQGWRYEHIGQQLFEIR